ncbi:RnfABCDGE type electron transport complex subunit D [Pseudomonas aeruginosa]
MLGYVVALVSFHLEVTAGPRRTAPSACPTASRIPSVSLPGPDAWARHRPRRAEDRPQPDRSMSCSPAARPSATSVAPAAVVNLAFLLGGLFLLWRRLFTWHAPLGMLAGLFAMSLLFWNGSGSDSHGSPLFHPVQRGDHARLLHRHRPGVRRHQQSRAAGRWPRRQRPHLVIRAWGDYPDGVAFAVLLVTGGADHRLLHPGRAPTAIAR